jgi:hypothetical protein
METAETDIALKIHETEKGPVVAACDIELVGKTLNEGNLELEVSEAFYLDRRVSLKELLSILEKCSNANLIGECVVAYCSKNPDAEESVIYIEGVPHLHIYVV